MAQKVSLFKDYAGGQGGGAANYTTYADDFDTDHTDIENAINQLVDEVGAALSSKALFMDDLLRIDDPAVTAELQGVVGAHSYVTIINGGDASQLDVSVGAALVNNLRAFTSSITTLQGSNALLGAGATNAASSYVDQNGLVGLDLTANVPAAALELASVNWDGTAGNFTGAVTLEAPVFFDGDAQASALNRAAKGSGPAFAAKVFRTFASRIDAIERMLSSVATDSEGDAIGTPEFASLKVADGAVGTPSYSFNDDTDLGFYRVGANVLGVAGSMSVIDGAAATPSIRFTSDTDLGLFRVGADQLGVAAAQILPDQVGTAGAPLYSQQGDPNTGIRFINPDRLTVVTGGADALDVDAVQNINSATQPRCDFERSAVQVIGTGGATTAIDFDVENLDIGGWGAVTTSDLTVPTSMAGFYAIVGTAFFEASATGLRRVTITLDAALAANGQGDVILPATPTGSARIVVPMLLELAAGVVVNLEVAQTSGGDLDVTANLALVKLW